MKCGGVEGTGFDEYYLCVAGNAPTPMPSLAAGVVARRAVLSESDPPIGR